MTTVQIRDADRADEEVLRGLFRRSALHYEESREVLLAHPETLEFSLPEAERATTRVAVLADGRIAGFATPVVSDGFIELDDLFVEPEFMRQGIATALNLDVVEVARRHHLARVEVTANPHALAFYEHVGFVADHPVETRFGPAVRMHLAVA